MGISECTYELTRNDVLARLLRVAGRPRRGDVQGKTQKNKTKWKRQ